MGTIAPFVYCVGRKSTILARKVRTDIAVTNKPFIAIVDDDEMVGDLTKGLIEMFGLNGQTFSSAEAFLNSDCIAWTSCLIADVQMPGIDGLQLHYMVSKFPNYIPVIFITAFPDEKIRTSALQAGAICYLNKPFDPQDLLQALHSAIGRWDGEPDS